MSGIAEFTDEDAKRTIQRAVRLIAIIAVGALPLVWWRGGGSSAALWLVGALISGSGLFEWLRLMTAVMERMDVPAEGAAPRKVRPMAPVMIGFFLRMGVALVALYVSLKFIDGSVYALAAGLGMGVFALLVEGIRLLRSWTI